MSIERKLVGFGLLAFSLMLIMASRAHAQEPTPPPAPPPSSEPAAPPKEPAALPPDATVPAPTAAPAPTADMPAAAPAADATAPQAAPPPDPQAATPAQAAPPADPKAAKAVPPAKKGKQPYTGPTMVEELPPTPMLDAEGKQRLDPDGKPMFNPPVKQQRDKQGHPLFDASGKPVFQTAKDLGFDDHGKKIHDKKEKAPKTISIAISQGTLTVDGMIGKAALNYDIKDLKYIYLYAPWVGTVVVSNAPFPGAQAQANGWDQHTLTVNVEDHTFQLYSDKILLGKKPEAAYVLVDRDFKLPTRVPMVGYGDTLKAPYAWPGAKENPLTKGSVKAPPVPVSLRPTLMLSPCPAGQMRATAGATLPGDPPPPCVPIVAGRPAAVATPKPAPAAAPEATPPPPTETPAPAPATPPATPPPSW